jgi:Zn-dependent membrane protease YugP
MWWPFYWNPTYWLFVAPALLLMLYAQWRVQTAYAKWGRVPNSRGLPGVKAAEYLLAENNLYGVRIQGIGGQLTDNYDPRTKTLNLSQGTAMQGSVAALAIVAHEIGHAKQDATGNLLLQLRTGIVPAVNIGSQLGPILFIIGFFMRFSPLMWLGIAFFSLAFVFALITLPVEIDASSKAMRMLTNSGLLVGDSERRGARAVLSAAALTYVAGLLMALFQLLYYVVLAGSGRRRH